MRVPVLQERKQRTSIEHCCDDSLFPVERDCMRALLVLNERSRRGREDGARVCEALENCEIICERSASASAFDAVIAAGGDGTVIRAVPLALELGVPLGIVPLGTFNDLARALGIPLDIAQACAAIAAGKRRRIDLGTVNGVYFVNEASVGISTRAARSQTPAVKRRFGALGVLWSGIRAIARSRPFVVELQYDGKQERFRTVQLTVANSARFGGIIERPDAAIDDGWLDLYSLEVERWTQAIAILRKILRRDATPGEGLRTRRSRRFDVRTQRAHHVTADGEPAGMTPARFDMLPQALDVLIP
jgi:diacylglycerol kinase (ATP)